MLMSRANMHMIVITLTLPPPHSRHLQQRDRIHDNNPMKNLKIFNHLVCIWMNEHLSCDKHNSLICSIWSRATVLLSSGEWWFYLSNVYVSSTFHFSILTYSVALQNVVQFTVPLKPTSIERVFFKKNTYYNQFTLLCTYIALFDHLVEHNT